MKIKAKSRRWAKLQKIGKFSGLFAVCIAFLACVLVPATANADIETWGPQDRPTFTWKEPADYVTFNSMTDNPLLGNERNFVRIRKADTKDVSVDNIDLAVGQEYEVSIWFHNNAKSRLNQEAGQPGVAKNVRLLVNMPEHVGANGSAMIKATISADNANPQSVWDTAFGNTTSAVALRYVPNSATVYLNEPGEYDAAKGGYFNNGYETTNGKILNTDALFGNDGYNGAMLGYYNDQWGTLPGCSEYSGYVQFRFVVDQPNFEVYKTVAMDGDDNYDEAITAEPGDILNFKIEYTNTGTTYQNDVVVVDTLPNGLTYIPGTTYFESTKVAGKYVEDGYLFGSGLNVGDFAPGDSMYVTYQVQVDDNSEAFPCGDTVVYNEGQVGTQNGTGIDQTEITIHRTCDCVTNPEMPGCQELPHTGPVEVAIATLIIGGIGGAGYYLYSTRRTLKAVQSGVTGPTRQGTNSHSLHSNHEPQSSPSVAPEPHATPETHATHQPAEPQNHQPHAKE